MRTWRTGEGTGGDWRVWRGNGGQEGVGKESFGDKKRVFGARRGKGRVLMPVWRRQKGMGCPGVGQERRKQGDEREK